MDENTKEHFVGIKYIFNELKRDIQRLLKIDDIAKKCRKIEYIKARSLFIKIIDDKYEIKNKDKLSNPLFTYNNISKFLNVDRSDIYHYLKTFNSMLQYSNSFHVMYNGLRDKWVKERNYSLFRKEVKTLRQELEILNNKFDIIYKSLLV